MELALLGTVAVRVAAFSDRACTLWTDALQSFHFRSRRVEHEPFHDVPQSRQIVLNVAIQREEIVPDSVRALDRLLCGEADRTPPHSERQRVTGQDVHFRRDRFMHPHLPYGRGRSRERGEFV